MNKINVHEMREKYGEQWRLYAHHPRLARLIEAFAVILMFLRRFETRT